MAPVQVPSSGKPTMGGEGPKLKRRIPPSLQSVRSLPSEYRFKSSSSHNEDYVVNAASSKLDFLPEDDNEGQEDNEESPYSTRTPRFGEIEAREELNDSQSSTIAPKPQVSVTEVETRWSDTNTFDGRKVSG